MSQSNVGYEFSSVSDYCIPDSSKNTRVNQSNVVFELSSDLPGNSLKNYGKSRFFSLNTRPRAHPIGVRACRPIIAARQGLKNGRPSFEVKRFQTLSQSLRIFAKEYALKSNFTKDTAISVNTLAPSEFEGSLILSVNGVVDVDKVLAKTDKTNVFEHVAKVGLDLPQTEKDFIGELNRVINDVHDFITNEAILFTTPEGTIRKTSQLFHPVIHQFDGQSPFYATDQVGFVTNINRQSKMLDTHCSVVKYSSGLKDLDKFRLRVEWLSEVYPGVKHVVKGVSNCQLDHFDGVHYHHAFGTDYNHGTAVSLPPKFHNYFTKYRPRYQGENLFKSVARPRIEQRIDLKHISHTQIIQRIPNTEFEGLSFTRGDLVTAFTSARDISKECAQIKYNAKRMNSSEYFAAGRARNVLYQLNSSLKALDYKLDYFLTHPRGGIDHPQGGLDYQKLATSTAELFDHIGDGFKYARGVQSRIKADRQATNPTPAEFWIDEAANPIIGNIDEILVKMENLGFYLENPDSYFSNRNKKKRIPSIDRTQYVENLRYEQNNSTWVELSELGDIVKPDLVEGKHPTFFNVQTNLSLFRL